MRDRDVRRAVVGRVCTLGLIVLGVLASACGNADEAAPSTARPRPTSSPTSATSPTTPTPDATSSTASAEPTTSAPATSDRSDAISTTVAQVLAEPTRFDGRTVHVELRAHFLEECPPPDGQSGTCTLLLFATDPERQDLIYADRDQAIAVWSEDVRVACEVGPDTTSACPGWTAGGRYETVGSIRLGTDRRPELHVEEVKALA